eukprot:12146271-Ditylum_brightwellii.AAC.2
MDQLNMLMQGPAAKKIAAAVGSLEVSSTNTTVAQVQSITGTYPEGAAAAAEADILQPVSNLARITKGFYAYIGNQYKTTCYYQSL